MSAPAKFGRLSESTPIENITQEKILQEAKKLKEIALITLTCTIGIATFSGFYASPIWVISSSALSLGMFYLGYNTSTLFCNLQKIAINFESEYMLGHLPKIQKIRRDFQQGTIYFNWFLKYLERRVFSDEDIV